jgi:hypothetical protein
VTDERAVLMPQDPHPLQLVEQIGDQVLMRSLAFYLALLAPLGLREWARLPTYRGTEEVIYLTCGERDQYLGLRPAAGGWRMADGGWRMADGGWRMADGGWR